MRTTWGPGDEVVFFGTVYTLIEPTGAFGWLAVETENAHATPRILLTESLKERVSGER